MAKLNFVFENGTLTATGPNTFIRTSSSDYMARTVGDGTKIEVRPTNLDPRLPTFDGKDYTWLTIDDTEYFSADSFVSAFNALAGTQFGFNTKYPEIPFSHTVELDTSVDEQVAPVAVHGKAGYITITTPSTNTGNIFVGADDVNNGSYYLEPDKSITLEISDLSLVWAQSTTADDKVMVIGVAKT